MEVWLRRRRRRFGFGFGFSFGFSDFRFEAAAATLSFLTLHARELMARPWSARCYGVARQREGSRPNSIGGLGRAFSPAFRAGSLYPLIPWRVGAEEAAAAKMQIMADGFG